MREADVFVVLERFHLAIAIVTIVASTMFLLALSVMVVDERRETVGILRLIGLTTRRILAQVLVEGLFIAVAGALFGLGLALASRGADQPLLPVAVRHGARLRPDHAVGGAAIDRDRGAARRAGEPRRILGAAAAQRPLPRPPMKPLAFAWRGLVRQPARAVLGIVGVAAAAALLFDMLLLSRGLVLSMQELLDRGGFSVRIMATPAMLGTGPRIGRIHETAAAIAALPGVDEAVRAAAGRSGDCVGGRHRAVLRLLPRRGQLPPAAVDHRRGTRRGRRQRAPGEVLLNRQLADLLGRRPGEAVTVRASCGAAGASTLPPIVLNVAGIAEFPFDDPLQLTAATTLQPCPAGVRR